MNTEVFQCCIYCTQTIVLPSNNRKRIALSYQMFLFSGKVGQHCKLYFIIMYFTSYLDTKYICLINDNVVKHLSTPLIKNLKTSQACLVKQHEKKEFSPKSFRKVNVIVWQNEVLLALRPQNSQVHPQKNKVRCHLNSITAACCDYQFLKILLKKIGNAI